MDWQVTLASAFSRSAGSNVTLTGKRGATPSISISAQASSPSTSPFRAPSMTAPAAEPSRMTKRATPSPFAERGTGWQSSAGISPVLAAGCKRRKPPRKTGGATVASGCSLRTNARASSAG